MTKNNVQLTCDTCEKKFSVSRLIAYQMLDSDQVTCEKCDKAEAKRKEEIWEFQKISCEFGIKLISVDAWIPNDFHEKLLELFKEYHLSKFEVRFLFREVDFKIAERYVRRYRSPHKAFIINHSDLDLVMLYIEIENTTTPVLKAIVLNSPPELWKDEWRTFKR